MTKTADIQKTHLYERLFETVSWLIILSIVFGIKFFPATIIEEDYFYIIVGGTLAAFILSYYLLWKNFPKSKRLYIQNISEVIVIGLLIVFAKDFGIYFFSLFLLPIIATALTLEVFPSIIIVILACVFVLAETLLRPSFNISSIFQLALIVLITIFCRFLALELRHQRELMLQSVLKRKELEESEKLSKEFIALASHQLLTPLSIIRNFASMIKSEDLGKLNKKQKIAANQIYDNAVKMVHLVEELLTVSRIEREKLPFHFAKTNLVSLLEKTVSSFKPQAKSKNLSLNLEKTKNGEIYANIDSEKIQSVLFNLLDNALKYTQKGKITVKIETKEIKGKEMAIISITDTGPGIPKEYQDRIFQPFFRGKNILDIDKRGTGLGLYIAKLLVRRHGGEIWVKSQAKKGSTFSFSLPLVHYYKEAK